MRAAMVDVRGLIAGFGISVSGCAATNQSAPVPGYTMNSGAAATTDVAGVSLLPATTTSQPTPARASESVPRWAYVSNVSSWREVYRGKSLGHAFVGRAEATVSTRVLETTHFQEANEAPDWSRAAPGRIVSQLVYSKEAPSEWAVAYVAESNERSETEFFLVASDGTIDGSAHALCAACHAQRSTGSR